MGWIMDHHGMLASVLLCVSEALAIIFPTETGFGGIVAGLIKLLKSSGVKDAAE